MKAIDEQTSITGLELLVLRPVFKEGCSVTLTDMLDHCDLEFAMKVNEYVDILESFEDVDRKKMEAESQSKSMLGRK
jgi:hypothetical protein